VSNSAERKREGKRGSRVREGGRRERKVRSKKKGERRKRGFIPESWNLKRGRRKKGHNKLRQEKNLL